MITLIRKTISSKPWLIIVAAFVVLIAVWTEFIMLAVKNQPKALEIPKPTSVTEAHHD